MPENDNKGFDTSTFGKKMFEKKSREMLAPNLDTYEPKPPSIEEQFGKDFLQKRTMDIIGETMSEGKPFFPQMAGSEDNRFKKMQMLNGNTFENGERSQGDQEAEQRMVQNKATGLLQKFVGRFKDFLNRGPFPGSEDDPRTPTGSKLITGPDGRQYDENFIKTIPGGINNMQEIERRRKIFEGM
tara:strand:+ start:666 stop:1220 length:555 start_codon:yes stop_codon:yes gene_type:complete